MAYIKFDLGVVPQSEWALNTKAKNVILGNPSKGVEGWPTKTVEGVKVFDRLMIADDENAIVLPKTKKDILKVFGIPADSFSKEDWTGVDSAWIGFEHHDIDTSNITYNVLHNEVGRYATGADKYAEHKVVFQTISHTLFEDGPLVDEIQAGEAFGDFKVLDTSPEDLTWHIAYADRDELAYTRKVTVHTPTLSRQNGSFVYTTKVELTYSLKDQDKPILDTMVPVYARVKTNDVYPKAFTDSLYRVDPDSIYVEVKRVGLGTAISQYDYYLRYDALAGLKLKAFAKFVGKLIKVDYKLKPVPWWVYVIAVVLIVLIVIISYILAVPTGGFSLAWSFAAITAIASFIAITATVISLVLAGFAAILEHNGYISGAMFIGSMSQTFADVAKIAGYIALGAGGIDIIANGFSVAAPAGAKAGDVIGGEIVQLVDGKLMVELSTGAVFNLAMTWLNAGSTFIIDYYADEDAEELQDMQDDIAKQIA